MATLNVLVFFKGFFVYFAVCVPGLYSTGFAINHGI